MYSLVTPRKFGKFIKNLSPQPAYANLIPVAMNAALIDLCFTNVTTTIVILARNIAQIGVSKIFAKDAKLEENTISE